VAVIVEPGKYLMAVSKEQLRVIKMALDQWTGPYAADGLKTPTQEEYEAEALERARETAQEIGKVLKR
jgi:hypothetical protein